MSTGRGRDDESLPVFDAIEEIEAPAPSPRPVPSRPGGLGPARGAGIAAGLLVLLVAGIVIGSLPRDGDPVRTVSPLASGTDQAGNPSMFGGRCRPVSTPQYTGLTLSPVGVPYEVDALSATAFPLGQEPTAGVSWLVPSTSSALYVPSPQTLVLSSDPGACLDRLVVTYAPTIDIPANVSAKLLYDGTFDGPLQGLALGEIPTGDWVLWADALYAPAEPGDPALVTVSFFRVIAGDGPVVTDAPAITPEPPPLPSPIVPCSATPATEDIVVELSSGSDDPVPGIGNLIPSAGPEVPPEIPFAAVGLGDPARIDIAGAVCAVSWDIRLMDPYSGQGGDVYHVSNPNDDPRRAAQNHWEIPIPGEEFVIATLHFAAGPTITRTWHVVPKGFPVPAAFVVAGDGTRFEASAGCGLTLQLANGYSSGDTCGAIGYSPTEEALKVAAYEPVTFEIPGWGIQSWSGICGTVPDDGSETFVDDAGCRVGGATSDDGGLLSAPATFVMPPGDTILRVFVSAIAPNGDQYSVAYFAHVIAR